MTTNNKTKKSNKLIALVTIATVCAGLAVGTMSIGTASAAPLGCGKNQDGGGAFFFRGEDDLKKDNRIRCTPDQIIGGLERRAKEEGREGRAGNGNGTLTAGEASQVNLLKRQLTQDNNGFTTEDLLTVNRLRAQLRAS